jgi:hypothetical protein
LGGGEIELGIKVHRQCWVLPFKKWGVKLMEGGGDMGTKKEKEKKEGCLSWQGDVLFLTHSFSWIYYTGAKSRKGVEGFYWI